MLLSAMKKNKTGRNILAGLREELPFSTTSEKISKTLKIRELTI